MELPAKLKHKRKRVNSLDSGNRGNSGGGGGDGGSGSGGGRWAAKRSRERYKTQEF